MHARMHAYPYIHMYVYVHKKLEDIRTDREPCRHGEAAYAHLRLQRKPNMWRDSTKPCASLCLFFRVASTPPVLMEASGVGAAPVVCALLQRRCACGDSSTLRCLVKMEVGTIGENVSLQSL